MKRNTLTTAVLAGLTGMAGMVSVSNATGVHVNPEGTGQALIYPFYTARGGNDTLISIVNTHERGKAVKVRFREALNSREVLDFHLYMSPFDVWTAAVTSNDAGGATLFTNDTSCTVPAIPEAGVDFLTFDFSQAEVKGEFPGTLDGAGTDAERTASGYIEVIEMASMEKAVPSTTAATNTKLAITGWVEYASKHVKGVPTNCQAIVDAWTANTPTTLTHEKGGIFLTDADDGLLAAKGGLFGSASIINVDAGTMFSYNAVALENFFTEDHEVEKSHSIPGTDSPNLAQGDNTTSHVLFSGVMVPQTWDLPIQAVSAALAQSKISNEFVTEAAVGAQTEWVVTFPTKSYHVDPFQNQTGDANRGGAATATAAAAPFTAVWTKGATAAGFKPACEGFGVDFWDREEQTTTEAPAGAVPPVFSPAPFSATPDVKPSFELCSEANVIAFSDADAEAPEASGILGEPARSNGLGMVNFGLEFDSGWASIDLETSVAAGSGSLQFGTRQMVVDGDGTDDEAAILGLPAVGFAVTTYTNGELASGALANYGGTFNHRGSRSITSSQ